MYIDNLQWNEKHILSLHIQDKSLQVYTQVSGKLVWETASFIA